MSRSQGYRTTVSYSRGQGKGTAAAYRSSSRGYRSAQPYRNGSTVRRQRGEEYGYTDQYWYGAEAPVLYPEELPREPRRRASGNRKSSYDRRTDANNARRSRTRADAAYRRSQTLNPAWVAFMMGVLTVMCLFLIGYISLQATVTNTVNETAQLESQLAELKTSNDQRLNEINSSINLDEIKYKAITRLGMSYADQDQVVNYTDSDGDYVHQVSEVDTQQ